MSTPLDLAVSVCLGGTVQSSARLHGGDLSDVRRVILTDTRNLVAKSGPLVAVEARMLKAIRDAGGPAPKVLGISHGVLLLEDLPETTATPQPWEALGCGLRRLHEAQGNAYGWPEDYAFGPVPIHNKMAEDWCRFWGEKRLLDAPEILPGDIARRLEGLVRRLPDLMAPTPPPSLLHCDLWAGNALFSHPNAYLIDPACYWGDAEVDLAMLCLFGTPHEAFWAGYGATEPDLAKRRPLYQLWPALVHLRLFGEGYRPMVETRLAALGA